MSTPAPGLNPESGKQLNEYLLELRLPAIRRSFGEKARRAEAETLSYEQYLFELAELECQERRQNRIVRLLQESKLPLEKTLENFDLKRLPQKAARQVKTLQDGTFLDRKENVLAFGNPGSGKTHLLSALGQELIRAGRRVAFTTCVRLVQDLLLAKRTAAEPCDSQTGILRSARDRRPGLCAAEPGRNGSAVHASGGTLRTWQRTNLIESCLLEMGGDLQRSDDDGGRHRSPCASQCDPGTQYSELSNGAGEKEKGRRGVITESKRKTTFLNWRLRLQTSGIYRDPAIPGWNVKVKTGGSAADAASRPGLAPKSALRLHPCRALSSAPVGTRVVRPSQHRQGCSCR